MLNGLEQKPAYWRRHTSVLNWVVHVIGSFLWYDELVSSELMLQSCTFIRVNSYTRKIRLLTSISVLFDYFVHGFACLFETVATKCQKYLLFEYCLWTFQPFRGSKQHTVSLNWEKCQYILLKICILEYYCHC